MRRLFGCLKFLCLLSLVLAYVVFIFGPDLRATITQSWASLHFSPFQFSPTIVFQENFESVDHLGEFLFAIVCLSFALLFAELGSRSRSLTSR